jgi:hypothetical protein
MKKWVLLLEEAGACEKAVEWASQFDTPAQAWKALKTGNSEHACWMEWAIDELLGMSAAGKLCEELKVARSDLGSIRAAVPVPTIGDIKKLRDARVVHHYADSKAPWELI